MRPNASPTLAAGLLALILGGCTHTRILEVTSGPEAFAAATRSVAGREAYIQTGDSAAFRWEDVIFAPDSVSGMPTAAGQRRVAIPTGQVREVVVKSRSRGAVDGLVYGALVGAVVGVVLASGALASDEPQFLDFGDWSDEPAGAVAFGVGGGVFYGPIIGVIKGATIRVLVR